MTWWPISWHSVLNRISATTNRPRPFTELAIPRVLRFSLKAIDRPLIPLLNLLTRHSLLPPNTKTLPLRLRSFLSKPFQLVLLYAKVVEIYSSFQVRPFWLRPSLLSGPTHPVWPSPYHYSPLLTKIRPLSLRSAPPH